MGSAGAIGRPIAAFMAVSRLDELALRLLAGGLPAATPVASSRRPACRARQCSAARSANARWRPAARACPRRP